MHRFLDFPPEVLDCVLGNEESSYLVVKLWLCGCKALHEKLSRGLTFLHLSAHSFSNTALPRFVFELNNLRHFAISSATALVHRGLDRPSTWPEVIKSLPHTLTSLSLLCPDSYYCLTEYLPLKHLHEDGTQRYGPCAIKLDELLPRLQTLVIARTPHTISSERFTSLPASLTSLSAPIDIVYYDPNRPTRGLLSQLPRGLLRLEGKLTWYTSLPSQEISPETLTTFRADLAAAPPGLQSLPVHGLNFEPLVESITLPRTLQELDLSRSDCFSWTPSLARTMPSNLRTMSLCFIDERSFADTHTNWVADIPRTLTSLTLVRSKYFLPADFTSFAHCLPPNLTELTMRSDTDKCGMGAFGDWGDIQASNDENKVDSWPRSLTSLKLINFWIKPLDLARLPRMLQTLEVAVTKPIVPGKSLVKINPKLLPSGLTALTLESHGRTKLDVADMACLKMLKSCSLNLNSADSKRSFELGDLVSLWPETIQSLEIDLLEILETKSSSLLALGNDLSGAWIPQRLTKIVTHNWHVDWFKHLPRNLSHFEARHTVSGFVESPLLADQLVFKDVPLHIQYFILSGKVDSKDGTPCVLIPPQRLNHLKFLLSLVITCVELTSGIIRMLPDSITAANLNITEWSESDLQCFPPRLEMLLASYPSAVIPEAVKNMPLAAIAGMTFFPSDTHKKLISERVAHEIKNP